MGARSDSSISYKSLSSSKYELPSGYKSGGLGCSEMWNLLVGLVSVLIGSRFTTAQRKRFPLESAIVALAHLSPRYSMKVYGPYAFNLNLPGYFYL